MALNIEIPKSDLAKSLPITDGWAEFEITAVNPKPSKDGQSVNYYVVHKLVGDTNEREIDHNFNSKVLGMMNTWIAALTNKTVQEVLDSITTGSLKFDLETTIGKHVMGKVAAKILPDGRIASNIIDWAPVGKVPF